MTTRLGCLLLASCLVALVGCADAASDDDCMPDSPCEDEPADTDEAALRGPSPSSFVTVTGHPSPGGGGTVSARSSSFRARCSGGSCSVPVGVQVTLSARAAAGYRFERWTGCADSTSATLVVVARSSTTCTASFVNTEARPQFTVAARGSNLGSVSASTGGVWCPSAVCKVDAGGSVSLHAVPAVGATFLNWSGCAGIPSGLNLTLANVRADATCTANFAVDLR